MLSTSQISPAQAAILSLVLTASYLAAKVIYNVYFHPLRDVPGPFWYRASQIPWGWHTFRGTMTHKLCELQRQYGKVVRVAPEELNFFTSQAFSDIYGHRTPDGKRNLQKNMATRRDAINGTRSIIDANEEDHRRIRRAQTHAFSEKALSSQQSLVDSYISLLIGKLHEKATQASGSSVTVDIVKWYNYTTFDILGELAFGESFGCLQDDILHSWITNLFLSVKDSIHVKVAKSFPRPVTDILLYMKPKIGQKAEREELEFAKVKAKARIQAGDVGRVDFMSYILKHNDERGMTMPEIETNASLLIIAGSETTATFLSGLTYNLLTNPVAYTKLRDLIRTTFPDEKSITPQALAQFEYYTACIEESFRLYPPAPNGGIPRVTKSGGDIIDGCFVPGNTVVVVPHLPTFKSPDNFAEPEKFVPERWLKGDNCPMRYRGDDRKAFQPFSMGPRNCIGMNLAYVELRMIMARMLWNFDMELKCDAKDWMQQKIWGLWEKKELPVKLTPRSVR